MLPCRHFGILAVHNGAVHITVFSGHFFNRAPVGKRRVVRVVQTFFGGKLARNRADRGLGQSDVGRGNIEERTVRETVMHLAHESLPKRSGTVAAGRAGGKLFGILVMADPEGSGIVTGESGEIDACVIIICAGFARNGDTGYDCTCARAGRNNVLHHVGEHKCTGFFKNAPRLLIVARIDNDAAVLGNNGREGDGFHIHAAVGNAGICGRHFKRSDSAGAECKSGAVNVDS